ncbi:hypothetical protein ACFQ9J_23855 [Streptomyces sp. NPDC056529]|uniref:hypothetical protein n=1 Tax=Streptomyces sp. NPDC056529 TaxID=3345855 RepID=UPI003693DF06
MRAIRAAASAALLGAAAVMTAGPAALADEGTGAVTPFGFSVTPETVAPGGTVTLASEGCEVPSVTVTSGVFDTVTLEEGRPGTATVDFGAKAGARYEITFDCQGERGTAALTVAGDAAREHEGAATEPADGTTGTGNTDGTTGGHDTGTGTETYGTGTGTETYGTGTETETYDTGAGTDSHDTGVGARPDTPTGAQKGVKAGYGTAASDAETDGLGTAEVVTGALLIVGALGSAVVLTRRRAADGRV